MYSILSNPPVLTVDVITDVFKSSDSILRAICVLLILASFAVWSVIFERTFSLNHAYAKNRRFLKRFSSLKHCPAELKAQAEISKSPAADVYLAACAHMDPVQPAQSAEKPGIKNIGTIHASSAMRRTIECQRFYMRKRSLFLKTAVIGFPFLGIAGLAWGILIAFERYAQTGCESIQPLAAGIPAALLPLVIALLALAPSLIGFRLISSRMEDIRRQLVFLAEEIGAGMKSGQSFCPEGTDIVRGPGPDGSIAAGESFSQEHLRPLMKHRNRKEDK